MSFYGMYVDIIGPIICSIIGGIFTVGGVYLTIVYEKNKEKEEIKQANKPLFYLLHPMQDYDREVAVTYAISSGKKDYEYKIQGIFKNTEKSIIIIDYILVGNKKYYSRNGDVIDKDKIFYLDIYLDEKIQENVGINLFIKDIFNNQYQYRLELEKLKNRDASMVKVMEEIYWTKVNKRLKVEINLTI